jgi:type IV pilus assembly protein PilE
MQSHFQPGAPHVTTALYVRHGLKPRSSAGFTMIELMITVAIVAILSAIAYPAYRNYVLRGQVVYATNALSALSANMERYFQDNRQYTTANGIANPCPTTPQLNGTFNVSCQSVTATTYVLQAVGQGSTQGFTYTLDYQGNQTTTIVAPAPSAWLTGTAGCSGASSWETRAGTC